MILCSGNRASVFTGCCVLWVLKMQFSWTLPLRWPGLWFRGSSGTWVVGAHRWASHSLDSAIGGPHGFI